MTNQTIQLNISRKRLRELIIFSIPNKGASKFPPKGHLCWGVSIMQASLVNLSTGYCDWIIAKHANQRYRDLVVGQLTSQPGFLIVPPRGNAGHHAGAFYCTPVGILFPGSPRSAIYMNPPPCLQPPLMQPLKLSLSQCLFSCVKAVGL